MKVTVPVGRSVRLEFGLQLLGCLTEVSIEKLENPMGHEKDVELEREDEDEECCARSRSL